MDNKDDYGEVVLEFRNAITKINEELFKVAKCKFNELKVNYEDDVQLWTIDFGKKAAVPIEKLDEYVIDSNYINYYWIIYDNCKKKWSLFYKDYDFDYKNIHIIPGFVQEWEKSEEHTYTAYSDNEKMIKGGKKILTNEKLFVELEWKPTISLTSSDFSKKDDSEIVEEEKLLSKHDTYKSNVLKKSFSNFNKTFYELSGLLGIKDKTNESGPSSLIYKENEIICWCNYKYDSKKAIFPYTIVYIDGAGFFTQYGKWMILNDNEDVKSGTIKYELNSDLISFDIDDYGDVKKIIDNFFNDK